MVALIDAPVATVKGGFFEQYGTTVTGYGGGHNRKMINFILNKRSMAPLREQLRTLNGATPAVAQSKTLTRITASVELGGKRTIETVTLLDGNSAAGDITAREADIYRNIQYDSTPQTNLRGNPLGSAGLW